LRCCGIRISRLSRPGRQPHLAFPGARALFAGGFVGGREGRADDGQCRGIEGRESNAGLAGVGIVERQPIRRLGGIAQRRRPGHMGLGECGLRFGPTAVGGAAQPGQSFQVIRGQIAAAGILQQAFP
jgi:hypothetical protein